MILSIFVSPFPDTYFGFEDGTKRKRRKGGKKKEKENIGQSSVPILNRNPCRALSSRIQPGGLNAATPGVEDTRNSQRTHPIGRYFAPPCPLPLCSFAVSLFFFTRLSPRHLSLLLHFLPPTTTYNQQQQQQQQQHTDRERKRKREKEKEKEKERERECRKGGVGESRRQFHRARLVSSSPACWRVATGNPPRPLENYCPWKGDGPASLSPTATPFSLSLLGNARGGMSGGRVRVGSGRRSRAHPVPGAPRRGKIQSPG